MARLNDGKVKEKHSKLIEVEKCRTIFSACKSIQRYIIWLVVWNICYFPQTHIISGGCFCLAEHISAWRTWTTRTPTASSRDCSSAPSSSSTTAWCPGVCLDHRLMSVVGQKNALIEFCWIFFPPKKSNWYLTPVYLVMESWNPEIFCLSDGSLGAPCWRFADPSPGPITTPYPQISSQLTVNSPFMTVKSPYFCLDPMKYLRNGSPS